MIQRFVSLCTGIFTSLFVFIFCFFLFCFLFIILFFYSLPHRFEFCPKQTVLKCFFATRVIVFESYVFLLPTTSAIKKKVRYPYVDSTLNYALLSSLDLVLSSSLAYSKYLRNKFGVFEIDSILNKNLEVGLFVFLT